MSRHVIIGRLGAADRLSVPRAADEIVTRLELLNGNLTLEHGIGRALVDLAREGVHPSDIGIDLLVLAAHVHAADTRIARWKDSQDGWTREIRLVVPVRDPQLWAAAGPIFERLLGFLTGDRWAIGFRSRPRRFADLAATPQAGLLPPRFDHLALFSGGLDSLIGAIDALEAGKTPLFISHAGEGATSDAQNMLQAELISAYRGRDFARIRLWMAFAQGLVASSAGEDTTRGRSFLFFSLGVMAGTGLGNPFVLQCPENGLIAINVPLDPIRLGALSTRTTHPFYIARWNQAMAALGIDGRIENPYWDKTKGEMVAGCTNPTLLRGLAATSLSCSSPTKGRWQGIGVQHCGYCLPCLIRRGSLTAGFAPAPDPTTYTLSNLTARPLNTRESEGIQVRSFQLAIERLRRRPGLAQLMIHKPGPLSDESSARQVALADVYRRGMEEVGVILNGVRTRPL